MSRMLNFDLPLSRDGKERNFKLWLPYYMRDVDWEYFDKYIALVKEIYAFEKAQSNEKKADEQQKALQVKQMETTPVEVEHQVETTVTHTTKRKYWLTPDEQVQLRDHMRELGRRLADNEIEELAVTWGRSPHSIRAFIDTEAQMVDGGAE